MPSEYQNCILLAGRCVAGVVYQYRVLTYSTSVCVPGCFLRTYALRQTAVRCIARAAVVFHLDVDSTETVSSLFGGLLKWCKKIGDPLTILPFSLEAQLLSCSAPPSFRLV